MLEGRPNKKRRRRLGDYAYDAFRQRLRYILEFSFSGDRRAMAAALKTYRRDLDRMFSGVQRPTVRVVAHMVSNLGIHAEWLLCGTGPVFKEGCHPEQLKQVTPPQSSFPVFDVIEYGANQAFTPATAKIAAHPLTDLQPYLAAGRAVYQAHVHNKLTGFFLGCNNFDVSLRQAVMPFYEANFADTLVMTLAEAKRDLLACCPLTDLDLNGAAKLAASTGAGYGETLCASSFIQPALRATSLLAAVHDTHKPALVSVELGEVSEHTGPALQIDDIGSALGKAARTDTLILMERLRQFFSSPGGVFFLAGEIERGLRLLLACQTSLRAVIESSFGFTFVLFSPYSREISHTIQTHGGHVIFLDHPTTAGFDRLFQTCSDVYAGKIPHTHD